MAPTKKISSKKKATSGDVSKLAKSTAASKRPAKGAKASTQPEPEATESVATEPITQEDPSIPGFAGNFDLYAMKLPFLNEVCLSADTPPTPQYEALYRKVLTYQAKKDNTARFFLEPLSETDRKDALRGRLDSKAIRDPMEGFPFDIAISSIQPAAPLSFTATELSSFHAPELVTSGPGISGKVALADQNNCGIRCSSGVFKMKKLWEKKEGSGQETMELFEGFFSFIVSYTSLYQRAGEGSGAKYKWAFWAVRAKKDADGKETGPGPSR